MIYNAKNIPAFLKIPLLIICFLVMMWLMGQFGKISKSFETDDIPAENAVQCDAVITDVIHHSTEGGRSTGTELRIKYTFEDKEYNEKIYAGFTLEKFKKGDILHLTVDKTNPHSAVVNSESGSGSVDFFSIMVLFVIASFAVVFGVILAKKFKGTI